MKNKKIWQICQIYILESYLARPLRGVFQSGSPAALQRAWVCVFEWEDPENTRTYELYNLPNLGNLYKKFEQIFWLQGKASKTKFLFSLFAKESTGGFLIQPVRSGY